MASFDNGHSADTVYLPHVGSSNKHFLCHEWLICIKHALFTSRCSGRWCECKDMSFKQWMSSPHIDLFVLPEWQVLYEDCVSFDCLCQWSEPTLSSRTVRHCTWLLLMNGSALHRSSKRKKKKLVSTLSHRHCESALVFTHYLSLICAGLWDIPDPTRGFVFASLIKLCKSFPWECEDGLLMDRGCGPSPFPPLNIQDQF